MRNKQNLNTLLSNQDVTAFDLTPPPIERRVSGGKGGVVTYKIRNNTGVALVKGSIVGIVERSSEYGYYMAEIAWDDYAMLNVIAVVTGDIPVNGKGSAVIGGIVDLLVIDVPTTIGFQNAYGILVQNSVTCLYTPTKVGYPPCFGLIRNMDQEEGNFVYKAERINEAVEVAYTGPFAITKQKKSGTEGTYEIKVSYVSYSADIAGHVIAGSRRVVVPSIVLEDLPAEYFVVVAVDPDDTTALIGNIRTTVQGLPATEWYTTIGSYNGETITQLIKDDPRITDRVV